MKVQEKKTLSILSHLKGFERMSIFYFQVYQSKYFINHKIKKFKKELILTKCSICDAASDDVDSPFILPDWTH